MQICFTSQVAPENLAAYREAHAHVWPEMLEALRDTGWKDYRLYLSPTGLLVGVVDVDSYDAAQARMAQTDVNARWQKAMAELFAADGDPDENMVVLDEIFSLDDQLAASGLPTSAMISVDPAGGAAGPGTAETTGAGDSSSPSTTTLTPTTKNR
ncbi:MAG: L-rhamnose mutarotase [Propionibacteriaceae bacterium]|nr:L-rhamnose mutarotase [Propionibacteriaceae bacterium]